MNTLDLFRTETEAASFSSGDIIFKEGQPGDKMYVVKEGEVEISVKGQIVLTAGPGELLGEMALIDSVCRSATATARTDCQLIPIDEKRFTFLVQQTPFFSLHVMRILVERLRKMNQLLPPK